MMTATADYLTRLDDALRDVPHGIAAEIRAGIAEELSSLDPDAAEQRIRQLGDPRQIAREALDAGTETPAPPVFAARPTAVPTTSTRGFAIISALALGFAGYIVPFAGWLVGIVLVAMSSMWRTGEKVVAIVAPVVVLGLVLVLSLPAYAVTAESSNTAEAAEAVNPLVPGLFGGLHLIILLAVVLVVPASGLWLLWRLRGRTPA